MRAAPSTSPSRAACVTKRLARESALRFWVCIAIVLMRKSGRPALSSAYGISEPKGKPGCLRESVESVATLERCSSVRARSACVGSGTGGCGLGLNGAACWVDMVESFPSLELSNEFAARTGRTENKFQEPVPFFKADLLALVATQSTTTSPRLPCKNTTFAHANSQKFPEKHRFHHAQKKCKKVTF